MLQLRLLIRSIVQIVTAFLLLFVALMVYAAIAEYRAEGKAQDFCATLAVGAPTAGLSEKAADAGAEARYNHWVKAENEYDYDWLPVVFTGFTPISRHMCVVHAQNGKVTAIEYRYWD